MRSILAILLFTASNPASAQVDGWTIDDKTDNITGARRVTASRFSDNSAMLFFMCTPTGVDIGVIWREALPIGFAAGEIEIAGPEHVLSPDEPVTWIVSGETRSLTYATTSTRKYLLSNLTGATTLFVTIGKQKEMFSLTGVNEAHRYVTDRCNS